MSVIKVRESQESVWQALNRGYPENRLPERETRNIQPSSRSGGLARGKLGGVEPTADASTARALVPWWPGEWARPRTMFSMGCNGESRNRLPLWLAALQDAPS